MGRLLTTLLGVLAVTAQPVQAQNSQKIPGMPAASAAVLTYADVADMALASSIAAAVRIRQATRLKGAEAATVLPGRKRYLVTAEVLALIRSRTSIPARIAYVIDVAPDAQGKLPKLTKGESVIFALPVEGFPSEVRLVSPDAQIAATPDNLGRVRAILKEAEGRQAPPIVNGIGAVFHVPGTIVGEGETQIFLETEDGRPVTLTVTREGGGPPAWSVALGEVVDQSSEPPQRNTLVWYRLACFLPATLPAESLGSLEPEQAASAQEDYQTILNGLGRCPRSLKLRPGKQSPVPSS